MIKKQNAFQWLLIFILIYVSNETLLFGTNENKFILTIHYIILLFVFLCLLTICGIHRLNLSSSGIYVNLLFIIFIILSGTVNIDINEKYIYEILIILIAWLFTEIIPSDIFVKNFINIMSLLGITSIVGYFVGNSGVFINHFFPTITNKAGIQFLNAFLTMIPVNDEYRNRNYSIFREPGVFQIFLCIALIFLLFSVNAGKIKKYKTKIAITLVAILTTRSTAGYLILAIILIIWLFKKKNPGKEKDSKYTLIAIIVSLFIIASYLGIGYFSGGVINKLTNENNSVLARNLSFIGNIHVGLSHPIFGSGLHNIIEEYNNYIIYNFTEYNFNNTNTFLKLFASFGFPFFILFTVYFFKGLRSMSENTLYAVMLGVVLFLCFSNEDLVFNVIIWIFVEYGVKKAQNRSTEVRQL